VEEEEARIRADEAAARAKEEEAAAAKRKEEEELARKKEEEKAAAQKKKEEEEAAAKKLQHLLQADRRAKRLREGFRFLEFRTPLCSELLKSVPAVQRSGGCH
jgi:hypothetical protein